MRTLILSLQYDGTNYAGWQIQKNAITVQEVVETAFRKVTSKNYSIMSAGRTDAGVHARGQIISVPIDDSFTIPEEKIAIALNSKLPFNIRVNSAQIYNGVFHSRFDAFAREYTYTLSTKFDVFDRYFVTYIRFPLNQDILFKSAEIFNKKCDFTTFSKYNPDNKNPVCDVTICLWEELSINKFRLTIKSNHFLYGMVRSLVGTMIEISRNRRSQEDVIEALSKKDRRLNSPLAPPSGLILNRVFYPERFGINF